MIRRMKRNHRAYSTFDGNKNTSLGHFRKWSGLGCKRAHCLLCHWSKHLGLRSLKQMKADIEYNEQLEEVNSEEIEVGKE